MITILFGRAAQFLLALLTMRVATTLLSPDEMGRVSLVLTTTACFALFLVNPVGMFINRRLHAWQENGMARRHLWRYQGYLLGVALLAAALLPLFTSLVDMGLSLPWLILLVCGSLLFNTLNQTAIPSLNLLGHNRPFVWLTLATVGSSFVLAVLLVTRWGPEARYWLLGLLLGQAMLGLWGARCLGHYLPASAAASLPVTAVQRQTLWRFAWPVALAAGLGWLQGQGYRYVLQDQLGLAELGLFVAGYGISAGLLAGFESVLTTYFQPRLYREANQHSQQAWPRYAAAVLPALLLTIALIIVLAPQLTWLFLGQAFHSAAQYVVWGALAEAARVLSGMYSLIAHVRMQTRWLIWPNLAGAALSLLACSWLIPRHGAAGAGMGQALSGLSMVLLLHFSLARGIPLWQPLRQSLLAVAALLLLSWLGPQGLPAAASLLLVLCGYAGLQYRLLRQHLTE